MLGLEFRKSIRGRTLFYIISTVALTYVLGYILPVGIDKLRHLTLGEFYFSTYTVFTQHSIYPIWIFNIRLCHCIFL